MADERLWYLSLPEHLDLPHGKEIEETDEIDGDKIWNRYAAECAEKIEEEGTRELTPPTLEHLIGSEVTIRGDYHGFHKIKAVSGANIYLSEKELWIPEDKLGLNFVFSPDGGPVRLFYMLRWLESPTKSLLLSRRELVGAGAGTGPSQPDEVPGHNPPPFGDPRRYPLVPTLR